jgi:spore maturation protein CgeB
MENNIPIYLSVNERNNQCSYNKYCNILGRSKIVINFSMSVDAHQLKGRPIEAFYSESLLLETYNAQTSSLFREGVDYVGFSNKEDMLEKVKYYLSNPREAEKIAKSGKERCLSLYNLESFWGRIFNEL